MITTWGESGWPMEWKGSLEADHACNSFWNTHACNSFCSFNKLSYFQGPLEFICNIRNLNEIDSSYEQWSSLFVLRFSTCDHRDQLCKWLCSFLTLVRHLSRNAWHYTLVKLWNNQESYRTSQYYQPLQQSPEILDYPKKCLNRPRLNL